MQVGCGDVDAVVVGNLPDDGDDLGGRRSMNIPLIKHGQDFAMIKAGLSVDNAHVFSQCEHGFHQGGYGRAGKRIAQRDVDVPNGFGHGMKHGDEQLFVGQYHGRA